MTEPTTPLMLPPERALVETNWFTPTVRQYIAISMRHNRSSMVLIGICLGLVPILDYLFKAPEKQSLMVALILAVLMVLPFGVYYAALWFISYQIFNHKNSSSLLQPTKYWFDNEKIVYERKGVAIAAQYWEYVPKMLKVKGDYVLYFSANTFVNVPESAFNSKQDLIRFLDLLDEHNLSPRRNR